MQCPEGVFIKILPVVSTCSGQLYAATMRFKLTYRQSHWKIKYISLVAMVMEQLNLGLFCLLKHDPTTVLKVNGYTCRRSNSAFSDLPPFLIGVNSYKEEFAPLGANSFF